MNKTSSFVRAAKVFGFSFALAALAGALLLVAQGQHRDIVHRLTDALFPGVHHSNPGEPDARLASASLEEGGFGMHDHEASEGPMLVSDAGPHLDVLNRAQACPQEAVTKVYDLMAIQVEMVLNRWGDRDPEAYMFALRSRVPAVRAQEALAGSEQDHFGLSLGVGADPIQPLTIRANVGDCVRFSFTNDLEQPASFHIHGADLILADSGEPALSSHPEAVALPGETVAYEWYVDPGYYRENTHYLHAHGPKERWLVSHGLFGALVVEPADSQYFDPRSGEPLCRTVAGAERIFVNSPCSITRSVTPCSRRSIRTASPTPTSIP
jgi:hypothetical protein